MGFSQGHAIVIGVGSHQFASYIDVPISVTDAKAVVQVLQDPKVCGYPPGQVTLLHDNNATKGAILAAIRALVEDTKAEDTVFFFYCGHGALGNDGNYYLVSHDAKIDGSRVVAGTGLSESELLEQLRAIKAKRLLMVINSCFSGNISPTLAIDDQGLEASGLPEDTEMRRRAPDKEYPHHRLSGRPEILHRSRRPLHFHPSFGGWIEGSRREQ